MSIFRHRGQILPWPDHLEARPISCKPFKSMQLTHIMMGESRGGRIALQAGKDNRSMAHSERKSQNDRKEQMVDIILLLMVIASAVSLLVVSPRDLQKKAILALREYEDMELSCAQWSRRRRRSQGNPE